MRRPAAGRKDRDKFISAEEQAERREGGGCHGLWRAPAVLQARPPASCADTTHARKLALVTWRRGQLDAWRGTEALIGGEPI